MPILREKVMTLLDGSNDVLSVVAKRYYSMRAPQGTIAPYITIEMPTLVISGHLRGITKLENGIIRFHFFGLNYLQLDTLRNTIIQLMTGTSTFQAIFTFGTELYEDDTRYFHLIADFSVWHDRS